MLEKDLEKKVRERIKSLGGISFKLAFPGTSGAPDRLIILSGKIYFIELKRPGGKLSARQKRIIDLFNAHGVKIHVVYSLKELEGVLYE